MRTNALLLTSILCTAALGAAEPAKSPAPPPPADVGEAIARGKFSVNARLRSESVEQSGLRDAHALTLRTRLGFATAPFRGWSFLAEGENIFAFDGDAYSQAGLNPGGTGRAVVADPETTELNQLSLTGKNAHSSLTVGRQRLILDNARFVGDVGWRQNQQTFDGVVITDKSLDKTTVTYAWIDQVNRVFSRRHAQGRWDSDSHLLNLSYAGYPAGTLTAYAYLLDFDNSAANSCATYGLSFAGAQKIEGDLKFTYRAEVATQTDHGSSTLNYRATYLWLEAGYAAKKHSVSLVHERLGTDNNVGFKTPLATLHAFNGWADLFLATPANGLRDTFLKGSISLPAEVALQAAYHWYEADRGGADYGTEFNLMASRKFAKHWTAAAKFADFRRDLTTLPNVRKIWFQLEFTY